MPATPPSWTSKICYEKWSSSISTTFTLCEYLTLSEYRPQWHGHLTHCSFFDKLQWQWGLWNGTPPCLWRFSRCIANYGAGKSVKVPRQRGWLQQTNDCDWLTSAPPIEPRWLYRLSAVSIGCTKQHKSYSYKWLYYPLLWNTRVSRNLEQDAVMTNLISAAVIVRI